MVSIKINLGKRDIFLASFIITILAISVAVAYGGLNPKVMGHTAGEIDVKLPGETKYTNLQTAITEKKIGGGGVIEEVEVYLGRYEMSKILGGFSGGANNGYTKKELDFGSLGGVSSVRMEMISRAPTPNVMCANGIKIKADSSNGFKAYCGNNNPGNTFHSTAGECGGDQLWMSFELIANPTRTLTNEVDKAGIMNFNIYGCYGRTESDGGQRFDVWATMKVANINGVRIGPAIKDASANIVNL